MFLILSSVDIKNMLIYFSMVWNSICYLFFLECLQILLELEFSLWDRFLLLITLLFFVCLGFLSILEFVFGKFSKILPIFHQLSKLQPECLLLQPTVIIITSKISILEFYFSIPIMTTFY